MSIHQLSFLDKFYEKCETDKNATLDEKKTAVAAAEKKEEKISIASKNGSEDRCFQFLLFFFVVGGVN